MFKKYSRSGNFLKFLKITRPQQNNMYSWGWMGLFPLLALLGVILLNSPSFFFCLLMSGLMIGIIQQIGERSGLPKRWLLLIQILTVIAIFSGFWLDYFADPAQAQFFKKAEDFFQNNLTQGSTTNENTRAAISLVFNVLRAIYLLYIAGSLIGVINAVRKDEEWQSVARTPLLVVIAVTIADVLTSFIVGDTSTK